MARRKFTREFKISAVQLVNERGYSATEAARSLGVDPASIREWVKKFSSEEGLVPTGDGERLSRAVDDGFAITRPIP